VCVCVNQTPSLSTHLPLQNVQESELNQLAWTCVLCACVCVCVSVFSPPPLHSSPSTKCSGIRIQSASVSNIIILPARAHAPFRAWRQFTVIRKRFFRAWRHLTAIHKRFRGIVSVFVFAPGPLVIHGDFSLLHIRIPCHSRFWTQT